MPNLLNELIKLKQSDEYPLHMPGHKRNIEDNYLSNAYDVDITEIEGYDNLYEAQGILKDARERAAKVFGADETFFLVNGSTVGILTAVCALTHQGDRVIMARNCHKSVYHAAELMQLNVTYVYPQIMNEWQITGAIVPESLEECLKQEANIAAVIITSPTYEGIASDIDKIAELVHKKNIPLIVDEAHGSHFSFHKRFPKSAVRSGADIVVQSLHKTLPSFTQTALLHVNGKLVDREQIEKFLSFFQSSSPSYLLMAGIDQCIATIQRQGENLWNDFLDMYDGFQERMSKLKHLRILSGNDPCKLVISTYNTSITGRDLQILLLEKYHIQVEMAAETYVIGIITQSDTQEGFNRLAEALYRIDNSISAKKQSNMQIKRYEKPKTAYKISQAVDMPYEIIDLCDANNRIAADCINLYPPGIPLLLPGEIISLNMIQLLQTYNKESLHIQGLLNLQGPEQIKVIKQNSDKGEQNA